MIAFLKSPEISVNPAKIKKLNWKFRRKNYQTDVLSFKSDIPIKNSIIYADIVICPQIAKKNAVKLNHSLEKEIIILAVHGFLHIADFDHSGLFARKKWDKIFKKLENIIK